VDFGLTEEQAQLADAERSWLSRHDPIARIRQALDAAPITIDPQAVTHAAETGLLALLTEDVGGSQVDLAVLSEVHGGGASSLPIADLALGTWLLARFGLPQAAAAAAGEPACGVALGRPATETAEGQLYVQGSTRPLVMGTDMQTVVVVGELQRGGDVDDYLVVVDKPQLVALTTLDFSRPWARIELDTRFSSDQWIRVPAGTVAAVEDALAVHRALDALGSAARLVDMTVDYAGQRRQFGAPIGSFQAVKHHCANMTVGVEAGRAALWAAALALDAEDPAARRRGASSGAAFAKSAASDVASLALQVHGGIGFTWEHDLHLFLRRIKVDEALNGSVLEHRAALVTA
jgi:alkylation response protein AidB-like acyl-CoA dehydrogenase